MTFSEKQLEIFKFPYEPQYEAIICDGAVRSGKTMCMSVSFLLWAMSAFNEMNFGICGKTVRSAERNVLRPLIGLTYIRNNFKMSYNSGKNVLTVSRGAKTNYIYLFGGKDESSYTLIQGITLAGVLLDEVALMPRSFVEQAGTRILSVKGAKLWFNCNPDNPQHWFYNEWILKTDEKKAKHLHFLMTDNPSLDDAQIEAAERRFTGVFYRRYILGEWVAAEGLVYPQFDTQKHVIGDSYDMRGQYYISCDYGTINPTVFLLWRVNYNLPREQQIVLVKEYYYDSRSDETGHRQKSDAEYYDDLRKFASGYTINRIIIDPSAASFKLVIKQKNQFAVKNADNDIINGIRFTGSLLSGGFVKIHHSCKNTIAEFGAYAWDEKKEEDTVIKENDHAMDAMRYFFYTIIKKDKKAGVID